MQNTRLPALDFDLGTEIDLLRATVRDFAEDRVAPLAAEIDRTDRFPIELWPDMGALGLGRAVLRGAFEPLRQSDPAQRHRGAEAQISAEADLRRACRRLGDERTRRRLRCRVDAA